MPRDESTFGIQVCTSLDTNELPAPVRLPALLCELDAPAPPVAASVVSAAAASTAIRMVSFLLKTGFLPFLSGRCGLRRQHDRARARGGVPQGVVPVTMG